MRELTPEEKRSLRAKMVEQQESRIRRAEARGEKALAARLREEKRQSRILLQVHDELVLEAPEAEVEAVVKLTREVMSTAFELRAPLKVEVEVGRNWLEMEPAGW